MTKNGLLRTASIHTCPNPCLLRTSTIIEHPQQFPNVESMLDRLEYCELLGEGFKEQHENLKSQCASYCLA